MGVRITGPPQWDVQAILLLRTRPREIKRPVICECVTVTAHSSFTPKSPEGTHKCSRCDRDVPFIVRRNEGPMHATTWTNVENIYRGKDSRAHNTAYRMTPFA